MSTEYGQNWRIQIADEDGIAFLQIGGETAFDWDRTSKEIDESSKDDGEIAATGAGAQKITFSPSGKLKLPDAGLARVSTVSKTLPRKAMLKVLRDEIVQYHGQVSIPNLSTSHPNDEVCTWKFGATACATPLIDNLGATV